MDIHKEISDVIERYFKQEREVVVSDVLESLLRHIIKIFMILRASTKDNPLMMAQMDGLLSRVKVIEVADRPLPAGVKANFIGSYLSNGTPKEDGENQIRIDACRSLFDSSCKSFVVACTREDGKVEVFANTNNFEDDKNSVEMLHAINMLDKRCLATPVGQAIVRDLANRRKDLS